MIGGALAGGLPILTYHALGSDGGPIATDPGQFARRMAALAGAGFRAIDLDDWVAEGRPPVDRAFALTFDDGLRSIRLAADVLARHGFRATAFLVTGRMGFDNAWPGQPAGIPRLRILGWSDLAGLQAAGFRFAAHTRTHPRLDLRTDPEIDDELRGSRLDLEDRLGRPCRLLAYPYGVAPARVRRAAARHFDAAFGTRLDYADPSNDPFQIARVDAFYLQSRRSIAALLSGRLRERLRVRRALREIRQAGQTLLGAQPGEPARIDPMHRPISGPTTRRLPTGSEDQEPSEPGARGEPLA